MAQRDNRHFVGVLGMHHPAAGPTGRCPVQPSTPLGPDQVNVFIYEYANDGSRPETSEGPGLPVMLLYAPNAEIRIRSKADYVLSAVEECVYRLYQGICD
jgi:hypothetical protein